METVTIKITEDAKKVLDELARIMAKEKGLSSVTLIDAASIAIQEAHERRTQGE